MADRASPTALDWSCDCCGRYWRVLLWRSWRHYIKAPIVSRWHDDTGTWVVWIGPFWLETGKV